MPFVFPVKETAQLVYEIITDVAVWIPPGLLWVLSSEKSTANIWIKLSTLALLVELAQIFVFSRVTDLNDIIMAMAGIGLGTHCGAILRPRWGKKEAERTGLSQSRLVFRGLGGAALWSILLILIFWYPFDFYIEKNFIRERLLQFFKAPLTTYYYSTEYRALTEVFHKILFFLPLGCFLSLTTYNRQEKYPKRFLDCLWALTILLVAFSVELGQVLLPTKSADITDCLFMFIGGLCGYIGTQYIYRKTFLTNDSKTVNNG